VDVIRDDAAAPSLTPDQKLPFQFVRYAPILDDVTNNVSDHCPVKIWF
jgi:hypothetical protein